MKVHCVIGGVDYEGEDIDSLKLFDCKSTAEMYQEDLEQGTNKSGYNPFRFTFDYTLIEDREIIMESLIIKQLTNK